MKLDKIILYKKFFALISIPGLLIMVFTCIRGCVDNFLYVMIVMAFPLALAYMWNSSLYEQLLSNYQKKDSFFTYEKFELIGLLLTVYFSGTIWWIVIEYFLLK